MSERLMVRVRKQIRLKHYSYKTEESYCHWIKSFIRYHNYRHPEGMGSEEITQFLTWLAVEKQVASNTQNLAFSSVLFLYREVLGKPIKNIDAVRAKPFQKLPVVLTREEIRKIIPFLQGAYLLMVQLLYGSGFSVSQAVA